MSDTEPTTDSILEPPVAPAVAHVEADVDAHTPATPVVAPADAEDGLAVVTEAVAVLATSVAVLTDAVADLGEPDESPIASVPWTHKGSHDGGRHDTSPDSIPWTHRGGSHHDADE